MAGPTQTWDYLTVTAGTDLTALGRDGWELVGIDAGTFYLKRPALDFRQRVTLDQKRHVYERFGLPQPDEERRS